MGTILRGIRGYDARWRPSKRACAYVPKTTFHNRDTTDNAFAPPTPCASRSLRAQHISKCCATPCTSDSPSRSTHRPCDEVTRSMQLCDPEKSHSGHFMLQQHAFGTGVHTRRNPLASTDLSQISSSWPDVCSCFHSAMLPNTVWAGLAKKSEVTDRALVRCLGIEVARVVLDLAWFLICVPSRDGSNRLHGAHAGRPLATNRLPSASWHPDRLT